MKLVRDRVFGSACRKSYPTYIHSDLIAARGEVFVPISDLAWALNRELALATRVET